jgi:hypothetical protein
LLKGFKMATNSNGGLNMDYSPNRPIGNMSLEYLKTQIPKGDPGGIVLGTVLGTTDLNTITTPGTYRQSDNSGASGSLGNNYPYTGFYGEVNVYGTTASDVIQEAIQQSYNVAADARKFSRRAKSNGVWSPWRTFNSTRVSDSAGRAIYQWDDLNNREQLVYGDTGTREISSLLTANWSIVETPNGNLWIRRTGQLVTISGQRITRPSAGITMITAGLVGFRPNTESRGVAATLEATPKVHSFIIRVNGQFDFEASVPATPGINFTHTYTTNDDWPTALPGSAVGTIPNL